MFRQCCILFVVACLSGSAVAQAGEVVIEPDPVVPFPIYSTDPDTPPGPTNLNATMDSLGSWTIIWDQPTDGTDPVAVDNYTVYWLDGSGFWQELTVDDAYHQAEIGAIVGVATVTVIATLDDEPSAAREYINMVGPAPGPLFPCSIVRTWLLPPPPWVGVDPSCIPI